MTTQHSTVSSQGQIFLPLILRKKYEIESGDRVIFVPDEKGIYLKIVPRQLTGALRGIIGHHKQKRAEIDKLHKKWKNEWEKK